MKIKDKLLLFLAFNAVTVPLVAATSKYEKLYDKMTKNLETGKSNDTSYKLIEAILNKRNKELKYLYSQNDYTIKPEFLEWQVFFSNFYNYTSNKGDKKEILFKTEGTEKKIDLGMSISVNGIKKYKTNLEIDPVINPIPNINVGKIEIKAPQTIEVDPVEISTLSLPLSVGKKEMSVYQGIGSNLPVDFSAAFQYNKNGRLMYENLNIKSIGENTVISKTLDSKIGVTGSVNYWDNAGTINSNTPNYEERQNYRNFVVNTISMDGNYTIEGNWVLDTDSSALLAYNPIYISADSSVTNYGNIDVKRLSSGLVMNLSSAERHKDLTATLINEGNINVLSGSGIVLGAPQGGFESHLRGEIINNGKITVNWDGGSIRNVGIHIKTSSGRPNQFPKGIIKIGNIDLIGVRTDDYDDGDIGLSVGNMWDSKTYFNDLLIDGSNGEINVLGNKNVGILIGNRFNKINSTDSLDNISNLKINIGGSNGTGFLFNTISDGFTPILNNRVIQSIVVKENSKDNTLIELAGTNAVIEKNLANSISNNVGEGNIVLKQTGYGDINKYNVMNYMPINIGSGTKSGIGIIADRMENYGDIVINSTWDSSVTNKSVGILSGISDNYYDEVYSLKNFANVTINTDNSIGLWARLSWLESSEGNITVNGNKSFGVYASGYFAHDDMSENNYYNTQLNFKSGDIEVNGEEGGVFATYGNLIEIGSPNNTVNATANGKNTYLFYNQVLTRKYKGYYCDVNDCYLVDKEQDFKGRFRINGNVNANLKNGAIGFYYTGKSMYDPPVKLKNYLADILEIKDGTLKIDIDKDSYLFAITKTGLNISDLDIQSQGIELTGARKVKLLEASLNVDEDSNLDYQNDIGNKQYRDVVSSNTNVTINQGISVTGNENNQIGIAQNSLTTYLKLINEGNIILNGDTSTGIYGRSSYIKNTGLIDLKNSVNGIGIFNEVLDNINVRKGEVYNSGIIHAGEEGVGIYAALGENVNSLSTLEITNEGTINGFGKNSAGVYLNNKSGGTAKLNLGSTSNINIKDSEKGIGIYAYRAVIQGLNSGSITVGNSGVGLYAKDSTVNLNNLNLNLHGDNAVGIYTDGTTSFSGTGNIDIDGKKVVIFNIVGTGMFNQDFKINSSKDSSYTIGNINNSTFYYNGTAELSENGIFINGKNSAVLLGTGSNLISTESNIVGISLSGQYKNGLPVNINGENLFQEATNRGNMAFGNNSIGIYVEDGARALNEGTINLGDASIGIYGKGSNVNIENKKNIFIGANSVGLYLSGGNNAINNSMIKGEKEKTVGIFLTDSVEANNNGNIELSGDGSVGIYSAGSNIHTINNTGIINIGDSNNELSPSIGIYSNKNSIVNNTGIISTGSKSIGIYNNEGEINHNSGSINVGSKGIGIYSTSGIININGGTFTLSEDNSVAIYGINNTKINNNSDLNVGNNSFGFVLESDSSLVNKNKTTIKSNGVVFYSDGASSLKNEAGGDITITGDRSVGFYMLNGGALENKASILGNGGISNIGIYNQNGTIINSGTIKMGDSLIIDSGDPQKNFYSVGIYGENTKGMKNSGNIEVGQDGVGIYTKNSEGILENDGTITSNSDRAIGLYADNASLRNIGNIILSGKGSIGIAGRNGEVKNAGTITMNGDDSIGIYAHLNSRVTNESTGKIYINGNNSTGIQLSLNSTLENYGLIEIAKGTINSVQVNDIKDGYTPPSIINAGVIKVDEKFELDGFNIVIKTDKESFRTPTVDEIKREGYDPEDLDAGFLISNTVNFKAPSFNFGSNPVGIDPNFTQGTNARVYKFENVFDPSTPEGGPNTGEVTVKSGSLTFDAIPVTNKQGKIDIWMEKINYDKFTEGTWYDEFSKNIEGNYLNATGDALKIYDNIDLITDINDLNNKFESLSGNLYSNINQRENDISRIFENSMDFIEDSINNTKENVKINVITGKGRTKETTPGVVGYDYTTTGALALREVERTYKHKFGYSLGYIHTNFEFKDGNDSEEWVDTIQLGLHNKYKSDDWILKNNLTGRVSFHNIDRNLDWSESTGRSEINGSYETYSITSDNILGKELSLGKKASITPYGAVKAMYMTRPTFTEKGLESLEIKGNDAWSVKPRVGVELTGAVPLGNNSDWQLKGKVDIAYEYELAGLNEKEQAKLSVIEDKYHKLSKSEDEGGSFRAKASVGVEIEDRYGIFLTGEYGIGKNDKDDYRAGVTLKAVF